MPAQRHTQSKKQENNSFAKCQPAKIQQPEHIAQNTDFGTAVQRARVAPSSLTPSDVLQLQRTIGNQAVCQFVTQKKQQLSGVQRVLHPEEEEELMMKPVAQGVGPQGGKVPSKVESVINRARSGGQPLESTVQDQMSKNMGYDFSQVRVHTGSEADKLNRQLSAKAFTTGRDIFFKQGTYDPASSKGRGLIAHELSHVVQQTTGQVSRSGSRMSVRPADDVFEREAEVTSRRDVQTSRTSPQQRTQEVRDASRLLTRHFMETRGKDIKHRSKAKASRPQALPMRNKGVVQRQIAITITEMIRNDVNHGPMMCQKAVGYVLMNAGRITRRRYNETFQDTQKVGEWVGEDNVMQSPYNKAPQDAVIAIKARYSENQPWRTIHVMLSVGDGRAYGTNNGSMFGPQAILWEEHTLSAHIRPANSIRMFYRVP